MNGLSTGSAFQPGDLLNNTYRIEKVLGRGGTSEVYKASSEISGRHVALKALRTDLSAQEDFLALMTREEAMRDIRHEAVVRYSENQRTPEGLVFLVMDFVDGPLLETKLREGGFSADKLMVIARRLVEGLQAAHVKNIVHRDLSPDNIILRGDDPEDAVIIDFGIAKDTNPGAETIVGNEFAGKYAYAAPEQLAGQTDARSDLYSLGALLLAVFRGQAPDVGRNPMEVVQKKALPLDTSGVPEPLKSLIERLSDPNPDLRFQSAQAVLDGIDSGSSLEDLDDILAPYPAVEPKSETPTNVPQPPKSAKSDKPAPKTKRSPLVPAVAGLILVASAGVGAWMFGLIPTRPGLPVADPYLLTIRQPDSGVPNAEGVVPSEDVLEALDSQMALAGGSSDLSLASGAISETWAADVLSLLALMDNLDEWQISIDGISAQVTGIAPDKGAWETANAQLASDAFPANLEGAFDIALGPRTLDTNRVSEVLTQHANCGPLELMEAPADGFPMGSTVTISGRLAEASTRVALFESVEQIAGDRKVVVDAEILNPALCLIEASLPAAPSGGIDIKFGFGDRPDANPGGRYFVGENPIIDVVIPSDITEGYLWVSALDVSGNVFHLLPNLSRTSNAVPELRDGTEGELTVRVAYSMEEAQSEGKLAFMVDDSTLGKSKIIVLHSDTPLFEELRPTTESASGYAEALAVAAGADANGIRSLDSRILTTVSN